MSYGGWDGCGPGCPVCNGEVDGAGNPLRPPDAECATCGPTYLEKHPHNFILRCCTCKEWLADGYGQLFLFPLDSLRKRDSHGV